MGNKSIKPTTNTSLWRLPLVSLKTHTPEWSHLCHNHTACPQLSPTATCQQAWCSHHQRWIFGLLTPSRKSPESASSLLFKVEERVGWCFMVLCSREQEFFLVGQSASLWGEIENEREHGMEIYPLLQASTVFSNLSTEKFGMLGWTTWKLYLSNLSRPT